jgi:hypothetical protein
MVLSDREKAVALITNAIALYSIYDKDGEISKKQSLVDFILKSVPNEIKSHVSMELIDDIFGFVSSASLQR